jgi:HK97 family phage prohead protease
MADSYKPTQAMRTEAQRGLDWRKEHGRGGTEVGIARARDIANGKNLPLDTVKRMRSFFARHEVDKKAQGFNPGDDGYPSNGRIAWALWGGDAGQTWANRIATSAESDNNRSFEMSTESLPKVVLDRLTPEQRSKLTDERNTKRGKVGVEVRLASSTPVIKTRDDSTFNLRGYATVYDVAYPIAGGPEAGGWMEIIERGATAKSINDGADVKLLMNHEGIALARTASGTMRLISDDLGMMVDADLDPESPYAQSVRSAVMRGDCDQMSFAFKVIQQNWNEDYSERRIREVMLFDASLVTYPASDATIVQMNGASMDAEERDLDPEAETVEDDLTSQIRALLAQLIAGEAAELESGSPAAQSIRALVNVLCALDWWEEIDEAEDASGDAEEYDETGASMMRSVSLAQAQAEFAALGTPAA